MKDEDLCEEGAAPKGGTIQPGWVLKLWTGFEFMEMALTFSPLLVPGWWRLTQLKPGDPRSSLPLTTSVRTCISSAMSHGAHLCLHLPGCSLSWPWQNIGAEEIGEIVEGILVSISIHSRTLEMFYSLLIFRD